MTILKIRFLEKTMNYQAESQKIVDAINKSLEILKRIESKR
jgi:hypothetical protein